MYAKVFEQILTSSIAENYQVRHIFMDFLVLADKEGIVDMTRGAIARRLNLPLRLLTSALSALEAPDPASRSPEADGRRLVRLDPHRDWGWQIVNFKAYDKIRDEDARRENNRRYQAEHRARLKAESPPVSTCQHLSAIVAPSASSPASPTASLSADADATKAKRTGKRKAKPTTEPPKPREPNPWWDAVCEIFGLVPVTKPDHTRIGKLTRDFKAKAEHGGFGPDEIRRRREVLAGKWQGWDMATPEAVVKHWDMAGGNGQAGLPYVALPSDQERAREAQDIEDRDRAARKAAQ